MANTDSMGRPTQSILIIDDDRILLDFLELTLRDCGYAVVTAEDGETGLQFADERRPDLIILDSIMPGMGGPEVLRALGSEKGLAAIPVMMLTALTQRDSVQLAVKLGADDYLAKPVDPAKLVDRVQKLLERAEKKKDAPDGRMEWKAPTQDFDVPLRQAKSRIILAPDDSEKK